MFTTPILMKTPAFILATAFLFLPAIGAEVSDDSITPVTQRDYSVLQTKRMNVGGHSVVFKRVAPPAKPPLQPVRTATVPVTQTAEQIAADEARAHKRQEVIFLSATIFDRRVTELRLQAGQKEVRVWSNVDFNHFAGMAELEMEDALYWLVMSLGNESAQDTRRIVPTLDRFKAARADYFPATEQKETVPAEATAALNALHSYYQANREQLTAAHAQRETERIAKERTLRESPPAPKNTVIHFWPKKSRNYPTK